MPWGLRARPSDGGGQAGGQRRAVGEMSRTPPGGPPEGGDRRTWRPLEASEQEVSGSGRLWLDPWDGPRAGEAPTRGSAEVSPQGERARMGWSSTAVQGAPITGGRGSRVRRIRTGSFREGGPQCRLGGPSSWSSVPPAAGPVTRGALAPPPKAPELPGTSGHSPQTCIYSHGSVAVSRGGVSPWTLSDFRPSSRRENPGWVAGKMSPLSDTCILRDTFEEVSLLG